MSTSTSTLTSDPPTTARSDKPKMKKKKIIILRLPSEILAKFALHPASSEPKSDASPVSTPDVVMDDEPSKIKANSSNDNPSEANSTPAPPTDAPTPAEGPPKKRKGLMSGLKRNSGVGSDGLPKPRGKPGPKKKPRLEDGTIDHNTTTATTATTAKVVNTGPGAHKLGPKANQGAINAGLRALDRSGKPCRRWSRKPFQLKSFTGVIWDVPSWRAPPKPAFGADDGDSEMNGVSQSSSDAKPHDSSTAMESNGPDQVDGIVAATPAASSPGPASSVVAAQA